MFIRISIWTKYRNSDLHICSMVWIYCKSPEFRGHYIFYSMYLITLYSKLVFRSKMARRYRRSTRRWLECVHRPLLLLLWEVFKKNSSTLFPVILTCPPPPPHLHEGIQWKDSIFRVLDDNTIHFNVCWVVWRMVCLDMNIMDVIFSCVYNFM